MEIVWSASKLNTYAGCSLGYYFNYIRKVKVPKSPYLGFGDSIHRMLERFHEVKFKSPESFYKQWKGLWFREYVYGPPEKLSKREKRQRKLDKKQIFLFENEQEEKIKRGLNPEINWKFDGQPFVFEKDAKEILTLFYQDNINRKKPDVIEEEFKFEFREHIFRGYWDRIDDLEGNAIILDYKSDKNPPSELTVERHPQLTIYYLGFMAKYGKVPSQVGLYHLRTGFDKIKYADRDVINFEYIDNLATRVEREVMHEDFTPFVGKHCDYMCDFVDVCAHSEVRKENGKSKVIINYPEIAMPEERLNGNHKRFLKALPYKIFKEHVRRPCKSSEEIREDNKKFLSEVKDYSEYMPLLRNLK
jgi:RecB family exonuclease